VGPVTIKLREPVQFGKKSEPVTELVLKPTARACRDLTLPMTGEGKIDYQPYKLALAGLGMAGVAGGAAFVDLMHVADMNEVALAVMGFLNPAPTTGLEDSQS
jgi:hypothetical protein